MNEDTLRDEFIVPMCAAFGWKIYWTWRSKHSPAGFPDLVMAHPNGRLLIVELKKVGKHPTLAQQEWLEVFGHIAGHAPENVMVTVWRPTDWFDGTIRKELCQTRPVVVAKPAPR